MNQVRPVIMSFFNFLTFSIFFSYWTEVSLTVPIHRHRDTLTEFGRILLFSLSLFEYLVSFTRPVLKYKAKKKKNI